MSAEHEDRHEELVALLLGGAMPDELLARFEQHLAAGCHDCMAEVRDCDPLVAELLSAIRPVAPSAGVRARLLARVAAETMPASDETEAETETEPCAALPPGMVVCRAHEGNWLPVPHVEGLEYKPLSRDEARGQFTALIRMQAGGRLPAHAHHHGPEECLVLEGELHVGQVTLYPGDFQRMEQGSEHADQWTDTGCLVLFTGPLG